MSVSTSFLNTCVATVFCSSAFAANLTVDVTDITALEGTLMIALYDSETAYAGNGQPTAAQRIAVSQAEVQVLFGGLNDGDYAIKIMHDENDNGELDTNLLGIPSEGYGFSNNAGQFGPASFEEARFSVAGDTVLAIKIR